MCEKEIKSRIQQPKTAFLRRNLIFASHNILTASKKQLMETLVWSITLYDLESWTIYDDDRKDKFLGV